MGNPIRINVQLTYEEYRRAFYFFYFSKTKFLIGLAILILLTAIVGKIIRWGPAEIQWKNLLAAVVFVILVLTVPLRRARRNWNKSPHLRENTSCVFSDSSILIQSASQSSEHQWTDFVKFAETKSQYHLVYAGQVQKSALLQVPHFLILPFRCFPNEELRQAFKQLAKSKLDTV